MAVTGDVDRLDFVWLEITGRCQLRCVQCYASSSPEGSHGPMTADDWRGVIDQSVALGVRDVQFIGGEPTLHPALPDLVRHALRRGLGVEVYSNLARRLPEELWTLFKTPGVCLATSYYSSDAPTHELVTGGPVGSHGRTRANIVDALGRSIPLRVGIVEVREDQDVDQTRAELTALGVDRIGVDRLRQVGRGTRDQAAGVDQLCGRCADRSLAVLPDGSVVPCVFARWMTVANVRDTPLATINGMASGVRSELAAAFAARGHAGDCDPKCDPCRPNKTDGDPGGCHPDYKDCDPWKSKP